MKKVSVIGLGYIGLPTAFLLAEASHTVRGVDIDSKKIDALKEGKLFFEEKGLFELFSKLKKLKTFTATTKPDESDVFIIAVPTPQKKGSADLKYVFAALDSIKPHFKKNNLIIIESTVGPTDCRDQIIPYIKNWNVPFLFAHCPERAIPGNTLHEMVNNDRIVGGLNKESNKVATKLYQSFVKGKLHQTDPTVAAASKVMENTYRAVNIGLANELALKAEKLDFNIWEAIKLANLHPRVNIHQPGPGVGGHCIPIDPWFLVNNDKKPSVIRTSLVTNTRMAHHVVNNILREIAQQSIKKPVVGLLGYAYKKNVDDPRETPTEKIKKLLENNNVKVLVSDPYIRSNYIASQQDVLQQSNIVIICTAHDIYKTVHFSKHSNIKYVYDCHNIISDKQVSHTQRVSLLGS